MWKGNELVSAFIEWTTLPPQSYLDITNADRTLAESQNLSVTLLRNANHTQGAFSSLMASLVMNTKARLNCIMSLSPSMQIIFPQLLTYFLPFL